MALQHNVSHTSQIIWALVPENQFAERVQEVLNKSGQVLEEIHVYNYVKGQTFLKNYQLSQNIEYQLAQNLAFIAVYEKSVQRLKRQLLKMVLYSTLPLI